MDNSIYIGKNKCFGILIILESEVEQVIDFFLVEYHFALLSQISMSLTIGSARNWDISGHSIDVVILQYLVSASQGLRFTYSLIFKNP